MARFGSILPSRISRLSLSRRTAWSSSAWPTATHVSVPRPIALPYRSWISQRRARLSSRKETARQAQLL
jgi:hypothetical protein